MSVKPLYDKVVVKRKEVKSESTGGIILLEDSQEIPTEGEVVAVGVGRINDSNGAFIPLIVEVGDTVLLGKYAGIKVVIDGEELVIISESELMGLIEE